MNSDLNPELLAVEPKPLRRILLWVAFDGAGFHGFQQQGSLRTVAGALEDAWHTFRGERVTMRGASRTDAGVHGRRMPVTFETADDIPIKGVRFGLDHVLGEDIAVVGAEDVPEAFHVRHDTIGKRYVYRVWAGRGREPTRRRDHWHVPRSLDVAAMNAAALHFMGEHDFAGFRTTACTAVSTIRSISRVAVRTEADAGLGTEAVDADRVVIIVVEGNAFLHNMVRIIAGTLVEVGKGKITADSVPARIASRARTQAGPTAPGHGLTLEAVFYGPYGERQGLEHKQLLTRLRAGVEPA